MSFNSFKLDQSILTNITKLGYKTPTAIQEQSIKPTLAGQDIMGLAQTGTGKTAAFALPIINKLLKGPRKCVRALIVAPTRELAQQIHDNIIEYSKNTGLRSLTLYGGVNINTQIKNLKQGIEIVVACPGRLLDHIKQKTVLLSKVEVLVLDEADQMFDMGFLPSIRKLIRHIPKKRQTLLFSATMPSEINQLAQEVLQQPLTIEVGHSAPAKSVKQTLFPIAQHLKEPLLIKILQNNDSDSVLVFTRTKHRAKKLALKLESAGFKATSLQGNLSQSKRQSAMTGFRDGSLQILVATDIASRGIDVLSISHVINYDMPDTVEAYTHRIGRTGRADQTGEAFTLITNEDLSQVRKIEKVLGHKLDQHRFDDFDYNVEGKSKADFTDRREQHNPRRGNNPRADSRTSSRNSSRNSSRTGSRANPKKALVTSTN